MIYQKVITKIEFVVKLTSFLAHSLNQKYKLKRIVKDKEDKTFPYPEVQPFKKEWASKSLSVLGVEPVYKFDNEFRLEDNMVVISNHRSVVDILILENLIQSLHNKNSTFVAKKELEKAFVMGELYKLFGVAFIDRQNPIDFIKLSRQIDKILKQFQHGNMFVIFPEGTRRKDRTPRTLGEFKKGFLKIAQDKGLNILPVYIEGYPEEYCEDIQYRKSAIKVHVGKVIKSPDQTMESVEREYKKQFQIK